MLVYEEYAIVLKGASKFPETFVYQYTNPMNTKSWTLSDE